MSRPSTRNLSEATRAIFAAIVARQTAALAQRQRAYTALVVVQERRAAIIASLDTEVDQARRAVAEADAELISRFGLDEAAELTSTPAPLLAKTVKAVRHEPPPAGAQSNPHAGLGAAPDLVDGVTD